MLTATNRVRLAATLVVAVSSWMLVIAYTAQAALPRSPLSLPGVRAVRPMTWLPQGWSFFTRDPQEERTYLYQHTLTGWQPASLAPHSRGENWLGLDRISRAQSVELARLVIQAAVEPITCEGEAMACLDATRIQAKVKSIATRPTVCGEIGVVRQRIVPWAWRRSGTRMPARVMRLEVSC
jgi:antimicrobial peptide system SdpA family protein